MSKKKYISYGNKFTELSKPKDPKNRQKTKEIIKPKRKP